MWTPNVLENSQQTSQSLDLNQALTVVEIMVMVRPLEPPFTEWSCRVDTELRTVLNETTVLTAIRRRTDTPATANSIVSKLRTALNRAERLRIANMVFD